jgi:parallel beta-helix repeat protein
VTIRNGTVDGFSQGELLDLSDSTVRRLSSFGSLRLVGDGNVVRDSFITDGDTGLAVRGDDTRILRNDAFGNDGDGIDVRGARNRVVGNTADSFISNGIFADDFTDVAIRDNVASSGIGSGIALEDGSGGVVERNATNDGDSGIVALASNLLIRRNEASRNSWFGIRVGGAGNTVKQNVANDNGQDSLDGWGIFVVQPGNIDGGGNRASGNGAPEQCSGVRCR